MRQKSSYILNKDIKIDLFQLFEKLNYFSYLKNILQWSEKFIYLAYNNIPETWILLRKDFINK